jgi:hypothetical protein
LAFISGLITLIVATVNGWPAKVALIPPAFFLIGPLIYLGFKGFFAWLARKRFAKSVINREKQPDQLSQTEGFSILRQQWQHGLLALRPNNFRGKIDPIKNLPWFLLLGPAESAKPSVMVESGLTNIIRTQGGDTEANKGELEGCDWYFFGNSVFLNVKGVLTTRDSLFNLDSRDSQAVPIIHGGVPNSPSQTPTIPAERDWELFLKLLLETPRRKPLEGVALVIPSNLTEPEREEDLKALALKMRQRLDSLTKATDQLLPVYLIISRLDRIPSLTDGLMRIEEAGRSSGWLLGSSQQDNSNTAALAIAHFTLELKNLFLSHLDLNPMALAPILAAPAALATLERPLTIFFTTLGHYSPHLPSPMVRGLYFSASPPLAAATDNSSESPSSRYSLIHGLYELFNIVMPKNRNLTYRLNLPGGARQKFIVWGLSIFYALTIIMALLLYQEVRVNRLVNDTIISARQSSQGLLNTETESLLVSSDRLFYQLSMVKEAVKSPFNRSPWPTRSDDHIRELNASFEHNIELNNTIIINSLKNQLKQHPQVITTDFAITIRQLLWLFGIYSTYLGYSSQAYPSDYGAFAENFPILPNDFNGSSKPYWNMAYNRLLFEYFELNPNGPGLVENYQSIKSSIFEAMDPGTSGRELFNFDWLISWAELLPETQAVTMVDFWQQFSQGESGQQLPKEAMAAKIPAAYTLSGRRAIFLASELLKNIYYQDKIEAFNANFQEFENTYNKTYQDLWMAFARNFLAVARSYKPLSLLDSGYDLETSPLLGTRFQSSHAKILHLLGANLKPFINSDASLVWIKNIEFDEAVITWADIKNRLNAKPTSVTKKINTYKDALDAIRDNMPDYYYRSDFIQRVIAAEPLINEYNQQANSLVEIARGQADPAVELVSIHFGGSGYGDESQSPFTLARNALDSYKKLTYIDPQGDQEGLTLSLRYASLDYLELYLILKVSRRLDELWNTEVVNPVRFLSEDDAAKALFGPDGLMIKFQNTRLAPFLDHNGSLGYSPRKWGEQAFPFTEDFLKLLSIGNSLFTSEPLLDSYQVTVSGVATLVDAKALEKPERTTLTLKSSDSVQTLNIFNYPDSKVFNWKPQNSGDTQLTIVLPSLELYLDYSGRNAFPTFLSDVLKGDLLLTPADFPDHREQLLALGITGIRVILKADSALPVVRYLNLNHIPLPTSIITGP